jgi:hypothetical protein
MIFQVTLTNTEKGTRAGLRLNTLRARDFLDRTLYPLSKDQVFRLRKSLNPRDKGSARKYGVAQEFPLEQRPFESEGYVYRILEDEGKFSLEERKVKGGSR